MEYSQLRAELDADPTGIGFAGMDDTAAAVAFNAVTRPRPLTTMTGDQMFSATDGTEWVALLPANKSYWLAFCGRESIDPFGAANIAFVQSIFGGGSATIAALAALRNNVNAQSRAQELGFPVLRAPDIANARAIV